MVWFSFPTKKNGAETFRIESQGMASEGRGRGDRDAGLARSTSPPWWARRWTLPRRSCAVGRAAWGGAVERGGG